MLDFRDLLKQAEDEMEPGLLKKAVKIGLLYGVVRQSVIAYSQSLLECNETALRLLTLLIEKGALHDILHTPETEQPREQLTGQVEQIKSPSPAKSGDMSEADLRRMAKQLNLTAEETDALVRSAGILSTDESAVIARTEEEIAREEAIRRNHLSGVAGFGGPPPDFDLVDPDNLNSVNS